MSEWSACEPDLVLINNLGVAFLRRISSDKAIFETVASAEPGWQHDCVCRIWTLLCESLKTLTVYALYAVSHKTFSALMADVSSSLNLS